MTRRRLWPATVPDGSIQNLDAETLKGLGPLPVRVASDSIGYGLYPYGTLIPFAVGYDNRWWLYLPDYANTASPMAFVCLKKDGSVEVYLPAVTLASK